MGSKATTNIPIFQCHCVFHCEPLPNTHTTINEHNDKFLTFEFGLQCRSWAHIRFYTFEKVLVTKLTSHQSNAKGTTIHLILCNAITFLLNISISFELWMFSIYSYTTLMCPHEKMLSMYCICVRVCADVSVFVPLLVVFGVCAIWLISC